MYIDAGYRCIEWGCAQVKQARSAGAHEYDAAVNVLLRNFSSQHLPSRNIARFIENAFNERFGEESLMLKAQTALSNTITKLEYISFKEKKDIEQIENQITILQKELRPLIEDFKFKNEPQPVISVKEKIDLKYLPMEISTKELNRFLIERYNQMSPLIQKIIQVIQSVVQ